MLNHTASSPANPGQIVTVTIMRTNPANGSYDPARGGSQDVVARFWTRRPDCAIDDTVRRFGTSASLYSVGHSISWQDGAKVTTFKLRGGNMFDCVKVTVADAEMDTGRQHGPVDERPSDDSAPCAGCGYRYSCRCERLVAPRVNLSQIRTLAAFESLTGYLSEIQTGDDRRLRLNLPYDDSFRTGIVSVDITLDGGAYYNRADGSTTFVSREESRAILRDLLGAGA